MFSIVIIKAVELIFLYDCMLSSLFLLLQAPFFYMVFGHWEVVSLILYLSYFLFVLMKKSNIIQLHWVSHYIIHLWF